MKLTNFRRQSMKLMRKVSSGRTLVVVATILMSTYTEVLVLISVEKNQLLLSHSKANLESPD